MPPITRRLRISKSYTIDAAVEDYVTSTRGDQSASERVNDLLRRAIASEKHEQLEREAAQFFAAETERSETKAFQTASLRTLARE
jgi:hypothetical protein